MLALLLAFCAGLLTVAAPCVLPILPIVFSSGLGAAGASRGHFADGKQGGKQSGTAMGKTANGQPLWMVLGFIATFTAITITFSTASHLLGLSPDHLRHMAIGGLVLFGASMVWRRPWDTCLHALQSQFSKASTWFAQMVSHRATHPTSGASLTINTTNEGIAASVQQPNKRKHMLSERWGKPANWGSFGVGMTLAIVWTPCAGPVLGSVLVLLATTPNPYSAAGQLLAFAIGAAIPMMAIAYGGQWAATRVRLMARYLPTVQRVFGVIVLLIALAMYFQYDLLITTWIAARFPSLAQGL